MNEQAVCNLDGYLLSLRRVSGNKCDYWSEILDIEGDIVHSFRKHLAALEVKLIDTNTAGYREIETLFETEFRSSLDFQVEDQIRLFVWDVVEYIQMTYRDIEPNIDPINEKKALIAKAHSEFYGNYSYIVIPVGKRAVAVGVATRA